MYFLDKIQSMATNNHIKKERISISKRASIELITDSKAEEGAKTIAQIRNQRVKEFHFHTKLSSTLQQVVNINKEIIEEYEDISASNNTLIEGCMKAQTAKLKERIIGRRNQSLNSTGLEGETIGSILK